VLKDPSSNQQGFPVTWTPDGSALLIGASADGRSHLKTVPSPTVPAAAGEPKLLISGFVDEYSGTFSSDGKLLAFASNESGKSEVYVCAYHADGTASDPVRVSVGGGGSPRWMPGGKSLLYIADPGRLMSVSMSVSITTVPAITAGAPVQTMNLDQVLVNAFSVLPDGRMLGIQTSDLGRNEVTSVNLILNVFDDLKKKTAKGK